MNVVLADSRVCLRTWETADVDALFEAASESIADVGRWLPWCHPGYQRDESAEFIRTRGEAWQQEQEYSFKITDVAGGHLLGGCGLNQVDRQHNRANLGYWIRTSRSRQGLATAATRLLARWAFESLALARIEITASVDNHASRRVAEKAGATFECIARRRVRIGELYHDAACYSLIRADLGLC